MKIKQMILLAALPAITLAGVPGTAQAAEKKGDAKAEKKVMAIVPSQYKKRPPENAATVKEGRALYDASCVFCHGTNGMGKGPVTFFLSRETGPHPRDFTAGVYKFRSSLSGELPTDEDLYRTITRGISGFMPGFNGLKPEQRWKLVYYLKSLYEDFKEYKPELIKVVGYPVPSTAASIKRGYDTYQKFKCWECHGGGGEGDGEKAFDLVDDWGYLLPPQNLTMPSAFKNGRRPEDLYRTIMGGLDGGAMPSFGDFLEGEEIEAWHLVNYILSLSSDRR